MFLPEKARSDITNLARDQFRAIVPPQAVVYTAETLNHVHAGEAYDIQFYLDKAAAGTGGVHPLADFGGFAGQVRAAGGKPVVVVLIPNDVTKLQRALGDTGHMEMLGKIEFTKSYPHLELMRVTESLQTDGADRR